MAKGNWRDTLDRKLLNILKKDGVEAFLQTAVAMLGVDPKGDNKLKAQFVGEVCEIVYWGLTQKYLEATGRKAKLFHSVVLKDLHNTKSDFRTECDFVLCAPEFFMTTECKSYAGSIEITKAGTLKHRGNESDVYRQSKLHYDKLCLYAEQLILPRAGVSRPPVNGNVFLFSNAKVTDLRSPADRSKISILTASTWFNYLDRVFQNYLKPVYDYERACKVFKACSASKALHAQHGEYVGYSD